MSTQNESYVIVTTGPPERIGDGDGWSEDDAREWARTHFLERSYDSFKIVPA
jgi:hypothetical protein